MLVVWKRLEVTIATDPKAPLLAVRADELVPNPQPGLLRLLPRLVPWFEQAPTVGWIGTLILG